MKELAECVSAAFGEVSLSRKRSPHRGRIGFAVLSGVFSLCFCAPCLPQSSPRVRYLHFDEVREVVGEFRALGETLPFEDSEESWSRWLAAQDAETRSRIDEGVADSISNLILYGTSFTSLPRVESYEEAAKDDALVPLARQRLIAFVRAVAQANSGERMMLAKSFLARQKISSGETEKYLEQNLKRFVEAQREYQKKVDASAGQADAGEALGVRGTLFADRGLSVDTSLLPNFALERTLASMLKKGAIRAGSMHRVAIIGPGLDYADKRRGYDFYPLQTIQPFAVVDTLARLGLSDKTGVALTAFDLNHTVLDHVDRLARAARRGRGYTIQLPRDLAADWSPEAIEYWRHFGEGIGAEVRAIPIPKSLPQAVTRAVRVRPEIAARVSSLDLNVVAQTVDLAEGAGYDLIVATNVLVYYDRFGQAVGMAGITRLLNPGGIFLCNNALPAQHPPELKYLGRLSVAFSASHSYGDDVVVYRKQ